MTAANAFGRQVIDYLTNKSGGGVIAGDVVVIDTANNEAFTTTTSAGFTGGVGVALETIANNAAGRVLRYGYAPLVNVDASVTRGHFGKTFTVAKQATDAGATRGAGTFCEFLTGGTTPTASLFPVDLLGSSLTNPMTTTGDIIYSSDNSGTPARLGIGAAGTALLGGTTPSYGQPKTLATFYRRTAGNYTLNNNSAFAAVDATNMKLTIAAATGDILMITLSSRYGAEAVNAFLDVATIVSASPVNYVSGGTGLSTDFGIDGWLGISGAGDVIGGPAYYTVQAGDISGGNVVLELYYRTSAASNKTLNAGTSSNDALFFGAVNFKH